VMGKCRFGNRQRIGKHREQKNDPGFHHDTSRN
jgi:hypothetical protein